MVEQQKDYDCPVCLNFITEPTILQQCKHIFCFTCLNLLIDEFQRKECPLCRTAIVELELQIDRNLQQRIKTIFPEQYQQRLEEIQKFKAEQKGFVSIKFEFGNKYQKLKNKVKYHADPNIMNKHSYELYVKCVTPKFETKQFIQKVKYELHETYKQPIVWVDASHNFELKQIAWGSFEIPIEIHFKPEIKLGILYKTHELTFEEGGRHEYFTIKVDTSFLKVKKRLNQAMERIQNPGRLLGSKPQKRWNY